MENLDNTIGKPQSFYDTFERKPGKDKQIVHYCPGCGHGRIHKLIAEALDSLEMADETVFVSPVGCSVFGYYYFDTGNIQAAHGRAPAVGTGVARANKKGYVISYQGDGDLAAIGTAEIIHAANRGENMTVIFVNNGIYGMTGGQMAPTSLEGQKTATSPYGRDIADMGAPIRMSEIIAKLDAPVYVERVSVSDFKNINKAKKAIHTALKAQKDRKGFTFVEVLSACPEGWKLSPVDAIKRLQDVMETYYPLGQYKNELETRPTKAEPLPRPSDKDIMTALGVGDKAAIINVTDTFVKNFKEQRVRISGFGGQGVLLAGTTLGNLAMHHELAVTWLPSYGPEMRGGTANCHVMINNSVVGTPVVDKPNVLIAMNGPSLDEFENTVEAGGTIFVNSSIVDKKVKRTDVKAVYVPMTNIAEDAGIKKAANMVAVAAYLSYSKAMDLNSLIDLLKVNFKKKELVDANIKVIHAAKEYVEKNCM